MSARRRRRSARATPSRLPIFFAGVVLAALALAALRVECIRLRYRLAEALGEERSLSENARALTADVRGLRDPRELRRLAVELGFVPPSRIVEVAPAVASGAKTR